jgi:hypothetical protein
MNPMGSWAHRGGGAKRQESLAGSLALSRIANGYEVSARDHGYGVHDQVFCARGTESLHTPDTSCPRIVARSGRRSQVRSLIAVRVRSLTAVHTMEWIEIWVLDPLC